MVFDDVEPLGRNPNHIGHPGSLVSVNSAFWKGSAVPFKPAQQILDLPLQDGVVDLLGRHDDPAVFIEFDFVGQILQMGIFTDFLPLHGDRPRQIEGGRWGPLWPQRGWITSRRWGSLPSLTPNSR